MTKDEAVAQMFASRAKVLENESANSLLASELVDALEFVVNAYEGSPPNERTMGFYEARNVARAAIRKATGEQA